MVLISSNLWHVGCRVAKHPSGAALKRPAAASAGGAVKKRPAGVATEMSATVSGSKDLHLSEALQYTQSVFEYFGHEDFFRSLPFEFWPKIIPSTEAGKSRQQNYTVKAQCGSSFTMRLARAPSITLTKSCCTADIKQISTPRSFCFEKMSDTPGVFLYSVGLKKLCRCGKGAWNPLLVD